MSVQVENGHTVLANELLEFMCSFRIPGMEMQVFFTIMRKTWGWKKKEDRIALSQVMSATKMKKQNAHRSLLRLIEHKLVIKNDDFLSINKNYTEWATFYTDRHQKRLRPISSSKTITPVIRNDDASSSEMMNTKETTTKETIQKKEELTATFLERFNQIRGTKYKTSITWAENFSYWNKSYSLEEMIRAVKMAQYDPWMNEVISPELLFRTRNKNGSCDYIGKLLNLKVLETEEDILLKTALKGA